MWNPLASLPASNAGALSAYAPGPVMTPGGGGTGAPLQGTPQPMPPTGLHPLYGGHGMRGMGDGQRSHIGGMADPSAFQAAMASWHGGMPDRPQFDMQGARQDALAAGQQFDPRAIMQGWQTSTFAPFQQQLMDWRQARPFRSDY